MYKYFLAFLLLIGNSILIAQTGMIEGLIQDDENTPLIGATIQIEGTGKGTVTDFNGQYQLIGLEKGAFILQVSYTGYTPVTKSVDFNGGNLNLDFTLSEDILQMDEVVVTASFNQKSKLESSVSITTLNAEQIEALAPISAVDALKNVPGVYVNDADGEVRNEIESRGLSTQFFSIQEDGLPSSVSELASTGQFARDMFLRSDIMTQRVEAVRGGSASITAANAPGGIFNYISATGGNKFGGEFRNRFGVQAEGQEVYNKTELMVGGPIAQSGWKYAVGGHFRYDGGNRKTLYPFSQGGQAKGNISKLFKGGHSLKIYGKWLDDKVGLNRSTFVNQWNDIQPAPGFDWTDNLVLPDVNFQTVDGYNFRNDRTATQPIRSRDQQRLKDKSIGAQFTLNLNDNWRLINNTRFSKKEIITNILGENGMSTFAPDAFFARLFTSYPSFFGSWKLTNLGSFEYFDINTGETLATIDTESELFNRVGQVTQNDLPTGNLFVTQISNIGLDLTEFVEQLSLAGRIGNHALTLGGYYHTADNLKVTNSASTALTVEPNPRVLGVRVQMIDYSGPAQFSPELEKYVGLSNREAKYSDPNGSLGYNGRFNNYDKIKETVYAGFLNDEWTVNDRINIDAGIRYEVINHKGGYGLPTQLSLDEFPGGMDGDTTTIYDNGLNYFSGEFAEYDFTYNTFSYSFGINYKLNNSSAVYGRYSVSEKLLDASYLDLLKIEEKIPFRPRGTNQIELGYKYAGKKIGVFAIAYRSEVNNIHTSIFVATVPSVDPRGYYFTPDRFNSVVYYGTEFEINYAPTKWFTLRSALSISGGTNKDFKIWDANDPNTKEDDELIDLSGQPVAGASTKKISLSPIDLTGIFYFNKKKGSFLINYRRFSDRWANEQQAFILPGFNLFKIGGSYQFTKSFSAQFNINNVFNTVGIQRFTGWNDIQGFTFNVTEQFTQDNPDAWFKVQRSLPRAFYLTLNYKF